MAAFEDEETSCGLCHSRDCCRPGNLRGRAIHLALCDSGRFCKVCNEAARAGAAQGRTTGFYSNQLATGSPAVSMEDEHRDDGVLGWRTSRWQQSSAKL